VQDPGWLDCQPLARIPSLRIPPPSRHATGLTLCPTRALGAKHPLVIDLDATLVTSHSEKEHAAPTFKRGFGFHPLCGFGDHGPDGTGEPLAILLRPGNAGSNTATDHIAVI